MNIQDHRTVRARHAEVECSVGAAGTCFFLPGHRIRRANVARRVMCVRLGSSAVMSLVVGGFPSQCKV